MDICDKNEFKNIIDKKLIYQLDEKKYEFILDLQKFNNNCYEVNCFLSEFNYFLRVFELKNKFGHFTIEEPKKQNIVRQISICITKKYNEFQAISIEFSRKERKKYKPIDIIYKPTKNPELSLLRYFTQDISKAYHNFYSVGDRTKHGF